MMHPAEFTITFGPSLLLVTIAVFLISCLLLYRCVRNKNRNCSSLLGKWVLVTGASSGLGLELAKQFYLEGARVILAARNLDKLYLLKESFSNDHLFEPSVCYLDLADDASIDQCAQDVVQMTAGQGGLHVLVNNAGVSVRGSCQHTNIQVHRLLMQVNYFGHIILTQLLMPSLNEAAGQSSQGRCTGYVVCISSVQGRFSIPDRSAYSASKHAFQAYFDALRAELCRKGRLVRVLVVSPGYIRTNLSVNALKGDGQVYGTMDETTSKGMPCEQAAREVIDAMRSGKEELILAPANARAAILIRCLVPTVYHWVMARRAAAGSAGEEEE